MIMFLRPRLFHLHCQWCTSFHCTDISTCHSPVGFMANDDTFVMQFCCYALLLCRSSWCVLPGWIQPWITLIAGRLALTTIDIDKSEALFHFLEEGCLGTWYIEVDGLEFTTLSRFAMIKFRDSVMRAIGVTGRRMAKLLSMHTLLHAIEPSVSRPSLWVQGVKISKTVQNGKML